MKSYKSHVITVLSLVFLALYVNGQGVGAVQFIVERNNLFFSDGDPAGRPDTGQIDNRNQINVFGSLLDENTLTSLTTAVQSFQEDSDLSILNSALGGLDYFSATQPTSDFVAPIWDFASDTVDLEEFDQNAEGAHTPVMLVTTSSDAGNLTASDEVGLVTSSLDVRPGGLDSGTVGFEDDGDGTWDTALLGNLGSLQMQAVPEPSTYALLAGFSALGWVALRRRTAKQGN